MNSLILPLLQNLSAHFATGVTRSYAFRKKQLQKLKAAVLHYEKELYEALYTDLKKSPEESWVTETGFLIAEINHSLKHLKSWMKPRRVATNLLNFPSKSFIYKEPLGVVLIIGPWNYPLQLLFAPLIGALAAGNCVVLKPSEFAPATAAVMRRIIEENFPSDSILYVEGDGAAIVPEMMEHFRFDHVFYTGSNHVGKLIYQMAATRLVPVTLELGGKSPCVVEADANIKVTARRIALTKFSNAGQMCVAPDYLLVHLSIKDELVYELKKAIRQFFSEDPSTHYNYGKIVNEKQFYRLLNYLQHGKVVYGGTYDVARLYIEPTLLEEVSLEAAVMGEEIFGPLLPILSFNSFEEAKAIVSKNPEPLAFYISTQSSEKEKQWIERVPFGGGCVNNASWHLTNFNLPFGGRGNSGFGTYHGRYSFEAFSHQKAVMKTPTWFDPALNTLLLRASSASLKKSLNNNMKHVLLLHGAIGSAAQLLPLKKSLSASYTVHLTDFPGHGGTPMPRQFSIPFFADHVKEYCILNGLQTVSIFGYSMGGYVGMYLARQYPELVEKVITLATKFYWDEPTAAKERKMLQPEVLTQKVPEFAAALQQRHAPNNWKQVLQLTSDLLDALGKDTVLRLEDYAAIHVPSLIMLGDRDKMVSIEEIIEVYKQLPQAQLAVLPATPHPIEQVNTVLLSSMIKRFLV